MGSRIAPEMPAGYYIDLREKAEVAAWPPPWHPYPGYHRYIALGQWGLAAFERHVLGEGGAWFDAALAAGEHLIATQVRDGILQGAWHEPEDFPHTLRVRGPWVSGMAQGLCASLLARLVVATGREDLAEAGRLAMRPMLVPTERGGCAAELAGMSFPEEYPTIPPSFVLNGAIYAAYGIIDVGLVTGDEEIRAMAEETVDSISTNLHRWDTGYWSRYDLFPHTLLNIASLSYHILHVNQLRALQLMAPRPEIAATAKRFAAYAANPACRARALARKVAFRLVIPRNRFGRRLPWVHRGHKPGESSTTPGEHDAPGS